MNSVTRISNGYRFGQIRKRGQEWHAEIRQSETGNLVRYAGIWKRKRDAVEEIEELLSRIENKC